MDQFDLAGNAIVGGMVIRQESAVDDISKRCRVTRDLSWRELFYGKLNNQEFSTTHKCFKVRPRRFHAQLTVAESIRVSQIGS